MNTFPAPTLRTLPHPFGMLRPFERFVTGDFLDDRSTDAPAGRRRFAVDVREENDALVLEADLPGFTREQIRVDVENDVLRIEADRTPPAPGANADASAENQGDNAAALLGPQRHLEERASRVGRRFRLPKTHDANGIDARLENGVLTLRFPKREELKPRSIEIR